MISKRILKSSLGLMLLAGATYAGAEVFEREQYAQIRGPVPCEVLDRNQDGLVSRYEYVQLRDERRAARAQAGYPARGGDIEARFERMDSNGDNSISREEFIAQHEKRMQRRQAR